jgi:dimethylamine monooxygenase subunit A
MAFDFSIITAPFRMQPGLRRLPPGARQLVPLEPGSTVFAEKLAVIARHADQALVSTPGFDAQPALAALAQQAVIDCPQALLLDGHRLVARTLGLAVAAASGELTQHDNAHAAAAQAVAALPPSQRAAALISLALHADFAVIDGASATLPWMAVCLPSHWAPTEKVGRHFAEVHAPVADNATLLAAGHHLMRLVCASDRWERFVWTITTHGRHDQHPARHERTPWRGGPQEMAAMAFLRTERQTFIPLPERMQAVFTIEVHVQPLVQAITNAADAQRVHDALATMSDAVLAYRSLASAREPLLAWLRTRMS